MKRIALALFAIIGVVSAGVFATSAYFTDTVTQNDYTFTTGNADLKFGACPGISTDCSSVPATLDTYAFVTSQLVGPGIVNSGCVVIENTGDYLLHLTSKLEATLASPDGMLDAFQVDAAAADAACNSTSWLYTTQSARSAILAGNIATGDLAPGARMYVVMRNSWDSTGDQNALQGGTLKLNASVTGKTD